MHNAEIQTTENTEKRRTAKETSYGDEKKSVIIKELSLAVT